LSRARHATAENRDIRLRDVAGHCSSRSTFKKRTI
jgi:hypothetical protein